MNAQIEHGFEIEGTDGLTWADVENRAAEAGPDPDEDGLTVTYRGLYLCEVTNDEDGGDLFDRPMTSGDDEAVRLSPAQVQARIDLIDDCPETNLNYVMLPTRDDTQNLSLIEQGMGPGATEAQAQALVDILRERDLFGLEVTEPQWLYLLDLAAKRAE